MSLIRLLEIAIGLLSINFILFPFWGSLIIPDLVAYLILAFDILWFYKSAASAAAAFNSHRQIEKSKKIDWLAKAGMAADFQKVYHLVIIPNANEPISTLRRTLASLSAQTFPKERILVVLAMEEREAGAGEKAESLQKEFGATLPNLFYTRHVLKPGEVIGKSSNEAYAGVWADEKIRQLGIDIDFVTVTTADCDAVLHPQYFSYLTYAFLTNPNRYRRFWQGALVFYNNIARIPSPARIVAIVNSVWQIAQLSRHGSGGVPQRRRGGKYLVDLLGDGREAQRRRPQGHGQGRGLTGGNLTGLRGREEFRPGSHRSGSDGTRAASLPDAT